MMKCLAWLTLSIALLLSACASDGTIEVRKDPFVGNLRTFVLSLDGGNWNAITVDEAEGQYTMKVRVARSGAGLNVGHPGDKGEFAVGSQVLTFENTSEVRPSTIEHPPGSFLTFWSPVYKLDRQQASAFGAGPLRGVKLTIGTETYQVEPNTERGPKFQQNMAFLTGSAPANVPPK